MILGGKHVESPFIELGQLCTILFFGHFLIFIPIISYIENDITLISIKSSKEK
jgi:ubiquinol-cytochrome c reductase cytochrome b subunit